MHSKGDEVKHMNQIAETELTADNVVFNAQDSNYEDSSFSLCSESLT